MEEIKTKICSKCGEEKPLTSEFWHNRQLTSHGNICKLCVNKHTKRKKLELRIKNPHLYFQRQRIYTKKEREKLSSSYVKAQIRKRYGNGFDITEEMIEVEKSALMLRRARKEAISYIIPPIKEQKEDNLVRDRLIYRLKHPLEKIKCIVCGDMFIPKKIGIQKYCSKQCKIDSSTVIIKGG